jgi:oxygen-independent coproporphyrinogen-3 oxidase
MKLDPMPIPLQQFDTDRPNDVPSSDLSDIIPEQPFTVDAAYLHVPFCFHKCHYCDFYSIVDSDDRQSAFVDRLALELACIGPRVQGTLGAVFIGGGTPTLLEPDLLARLLGAVREHLPLADDLEWTVEANPETVDPTVAAVLVEGGVNRISIGCQSFQPELLETLERHHDPSSVARAVEHLRVAGLGAFNLDLIHGVPGSTLEQWQDDLGQALALHPDHLSCYGLQYEPNTPLTRKLELGRIKRLDEDLEARMYEQTCRLLGDEGYDHYEISNWCRPGATCRHNLVYWRSGDWLAFGPSASGHLDGTRWKNVPRLGEWLDSDPWTRVIDVERADASGRVGERLMLELRLREGISHKRLEQLLGQSDPGGRRREAIRKSLERGHLESSNGGLRLSDRGILLSDSLLSELI